MNARIHPHLVETARDPSVERAARDTLGRFLRKGPPVAKAATRFAPYCSFLALHRWRMVDRALWSHPEQGQARVGPVRKRPSTTKITLEEAGGGLAAGRILVELGSGDEGTPAGGLRSDRVQRSINVTYKRQ